MVVIVSEETDGNSKVYSTTTLKINVVAHLEDIFIKGEHLNFPKT